MSYILGIDGGGTKTICVIMDCQQKILGGGEGGSANYQTVGINDAKESIETAIYGAVIQVLKSRIDKVSNQVLNNLRKVEINGICLGLAGVGRSQDIEVVKNIVESLKQSDSLPIIWNLKPQNIIICHDALVSMVGGIGSDVGIVAAAGTGSIVFGRNQEGKTKRVGGWGSILGDEGSAYQIAVSGMKAALQAYDGRGEQTCLIEAFQNHLGLESIENLVEIVYRSGWKVKDIAALAVVVDNTAVDGDAIANQIIDDAVYELVKSVYVVIDELFPSNTDNQKNNQVDIEIVTTGSLWKSRSGMWDKFARSFEELKVIRPRFEPAYGAALLALKSFD